jgi:hypothetical protein
VKLYYATVEVEVYFWSGSDSAAEHDAERAAREALSDGSDGATVRVEPVEADHRVPPEWRDALAYCDDDQAPSLTVSQAIDALQEAHDAEMADATRDLPQEKLPL